jgi:hypothetical protein
MTTTAAFAGSILNNTTSNNTVGAGISLDVLRMDGMISGNTANTNGADGIRIVAQQMGLTTGFSGEIDGNTTNSNALNGLNLIGLSSIFESALRNNSAMSNTLAGIRFEGAFNGGLLQNTAASNSGEGIRMILGGSQASVVNLTGNTVSANNVAAVGMVSGSQFLLQNTGSGSVNIQFDGNVSTDTVAASAFNFDLINTGTGSITPTIVPPSAATGTVGLNGIQFFP